MSELDLLKALDEMLLIRQFETRAESAYLQGKIGGFFHSYIGQEAIQVAALQAFGRKNWWITTYRCHALALLTGATPKEVMAELYGKATGNAKGRGGSMHLYTDRMLGGFAIVGGHVPIATGVAFALKYQEIKDELALCFLGEGAVAQGAFHESLNLASLWNLPCIYIIENNQWGMGTHVERALCMKKIAEELAPAYGMKGYTVDGMDLTACYELFVKVKKEVLQTGRPVLIEAVTERFKGHSISDPGLYRTKEELKEAMQHDPIEKLKAKLNLSEESFKEREKKAKESAIEAMEYADASPWPDPQELETGVFAPCS